MKQIELSIIIVNYHSVKYCLELVPNVFDKLKNIAFEIIIVENDPKSDDFETLKKEFGDNKKIKLIRAEKNLGFGTGNNLGAKKAVGEYLLLLNPDTKIVDDSIEKMLDFLAKHSEIAALSPLIYQTDGENLQRHFFADFQSFGLILLKRWKGKTADLSQKFFYSDMVTGAALMVKRSIFERVGGFDQHYFMYIEDDDLCHEFSKIGYKNAVLTTAKIIHYEGKSSTSYEKKKFYYISQDYYWRKHYGPFLTFLMQVVRFPYVLWQKIRN